MPPKGTTKLAPPRLPPLSKLRVRRPNQMELNPCLGIMSSVLGICVGFGFWGKPLLTVCAGCWASSGHSIAGCAALEQQLRACMDAPVCFLLIYLIPVFYKAGVMWRGNAQDQLLMADINRAEAEEPEKEHDQPPSFQTVS